MLSGAYLNVAFYNVCFYDVIGFYILFTCAGMWLCVAYVHLMQGLHAARAK